MLAAGLGTRLRPLTELRPKALCPVDNTPLVDWAIARVKPVASAVAVNVHHYRDQMEAHLSGRVHLSVEESEALGTAGALGLLRPWIAGRPVLVTNADSWFPDDLDEMTEDWDGERVRLRVVRDPARGDFGELRYAGAALLPWSTVHPLEAVPSGLYEESWGALEAAGRLELWEADGPFVACDTPADYLEANMLASGGETVAAPDAVIEGEAVGCVLWPRTLVRSDERLVAAIRASNELTVQVSQQSSG